MIGKLIVAVIAILIGLIIYRQISDRALRSGLKDKRRSKPKSIDGKTETLEWDEKTKTYRTKQ